MDRPLGDLRKRCAGRYLRRVRGIASMCIVRQTVGHLRGHLLVESLLILLERVFLPRG